MKTFKIFSTAALALMMAACSSEDAALNNSPAQQQGRKVHFTATIAAPGGNAGTRTEYTEVTEGDAAGTINVAWKANDKIALIHNGTKDVVTVETVNEDGSATITGDITVGTNDKAVTAYYPAAAIELNNDKNPVPAAAYTEKMLAQDGTLSYIASNLDLRVGESTLAVDGDKATLASSVSLTSNTAIWKLTLQDNAETPAALSATQVSVIKDGETPETLASTATLSTATSTVYLAMPPMSESEATVAIKAATADGTYIYVNSGLTLAAGKYYQSTVKMAPAVTDLSELKENYIAQDGDVLTGTLEGSTQKYKITIADGATVTLDGVTINGWNDRVRTALESVVPWAGITCLGNATIILKDGKTNTVTGFYHDYPGIQVSSEGTLTIKGTGSLTASSNGMGAGIGGGYGIACGNIKIEGGTITATGGSSAAGIGSGSGGTCSDITISGGTVTATGGSNAAGIGSGYNADCGDIKITSGVTKVTATKGAGAPNSIGKGGRGANCGTVTIGGVEGAITTSPYTYDPNAPAAWAANEYNEASWDNTNSKVVYTKNSATNYGVVSSQTSSMIIWDSAWLTVSGNVTLTGTVNLTQDVNLILQDGATLTINGQIDCGSNNLKIYGQEKGDGKLNVTNNSGTAININTNYRIEIHGGEVTAEATTYDNGIKNCDIKVYGGKLTATSASAEGISNSGNFEVYGGEVEATSTAAGNNYCAGIEDCTLIVYGGKVKCTGQENGPGYCFGMRSRLKSGTSDIKFYFSADGTNWSNGYYYGEASSSDEFKRYGKAE